MEKQILIFEPLKFYSQEDEQLFFEWINKVKCIEDYKGIGKQLRITVSSTVISFDDYRNLNGLFRRYKLKNPSQLKKLFKINES